MIDQDLFRAVLRNLAAGVTIVTTKLNDVYIGVTVTSFTSLSLDPMLVQFSLDRESRTRAALVETGFFCVNFLSSDQAELARRFTMQDIDRFEGLGVVEGDSGAPAIRGAISSLECRLKESLVRGDHTIFIGEPISATPASEENPLVYYQGNYRRLEKEEAL